MKTISSRKTYVLKKVLPIFWFAALVIPVSAAFLVRAPNPDRLILLVAPCFIGAFGFFMFRKLLWDLADEVQDGGDFLVVRKGSETETIRLDNIMNVSATTTMNPPRITLRLAKPGHFGNEVSFSPVKPFTLNMFAKNAIAEDLIVRVDAARRGKSRA